MYGFAARPRQETQWQIFTEPIELLDTDLAYISTVFNLNEIGEAKLRDARLQVPMAQRVEINVAESQTLLMRYKDLSQFTFPAVVLVPKYFARNFIDCHPFLMPKANAEQLGLKCLHAPRDDISLLHRGDEDDSDDDPDDDKSFYSVLHKIKALQLSFLMRNQDSMIDVARRTIFI